MAKTTTTKYQIETNDFLANVTVTPIAVDQIHMDDYQRYLDAPRSREIARKYNHYRMEPIKVSYREGKYWCFDGQHRLAAYRLMNKVSIPCIIYYGMTHDQEAENFAAQTDDTSRINNRAKFNARRTGNNADVKKICDICAKHGYGVAAKGVDKLINIQCIASIEQIYQQQGADGLNWVMGTIEKCWYGLPHAVSCDIIDGLAAIRNLHKDKLDYKRLCNILGKTMPETIIRDSSLYRTGGCRRNDKRGIPAAKIIMRLYNNGYRSDSPKRLADPFTVW